MKVIQKLPLIIVFSFGLFACGSNYSEKSLDDQSAPPISAEEYSIESERAMNYSTNTKQMARMEIADHMEVLDEKQVSSMPNYAAIMYSENNVTDTMKNLIRTADLKFRVKNIVEATLVMERIINNFGGYVENSRLNTGINYTRKVQISEDSLETTNYCTAYNTMKLRVPSRHFNQAIKDFTPLVEYLDYRTLSANDVTIDIIRQQLAEKRANMRTRRMQNAVDSKSAKLNDAINAEERIAYQQEMEDNAKVEKLILRNRIDVSTINIQIYQDNIVDVQRSAIKKISQEYKPSFASRAANAFKNGWDILGGFVLFLIDSWSVLLIIAVIVFLLRKFYLIKIKNKQELK